jgi:hypothetical protein
MHQSRSSLMKSADGSGPHALSKPLPLHSQILLGWIAATISLHSIPYRGISVGSFAHPVEIYLKLARRMTPTAIDQLWVADITYTHAYPDDWLGAGAERTGRRTPTSLHRLRAGILAKWESPPR